MPFARLNNRLLKNKIKIIPMFIIPECMPYDASCIQQLRKERVLSRLQSLLSVLSACTEAINNRKQNVCSLTRPHSV